MNVRALPIWRKPVGDGAKRTRSIGKPQYNKRSARLGIYDIGMPLLRLIAEGVGPFERLDVDLSDGKGNPHLGPHIFAGVNGSGKSTVLRALACVMGSDELGFPYEEWERVLTGRFRSRALLVVKTEGAPTEVPVWAYRRIREGG